MNRYNRYDPRIAILPFGVVNVITGKNKMFNIYETWGDSPESIAEVWETYDKSYVLIFSAGSFNREPGEYKCFKHDQTSNNLFGGSNLKFVKEYKLSDLKSAADEFGKSLRGYVYK